MAAKYQDYLRDLRLAFPQPVSDRFHDAYFVFSILRALDQIDHKKSELPWLGRVEPVDFGNAERASLADAPRKLEDVIPRLVDHLEGMFIWSHPRSQVNVVQAPSIASVIGALLATIYNPNLCSEESSRKIALAEAEVSAMTARLVGYDPARSAGFFTFGGTGANLYGCRIGLEKAIPGAMGDGLFGAPRAVVIASEQSHYCRLNIASWLGLGERQSIAVPTALDNAIDIDALEVTLRERLGAGERVAALIATMGTTDAFGIDDLAALVALRDRLAQEFELPYRPHVHADAVIGWAWTTFNDYEFEQNPLGFRARTVRALAKARERLRHLHLADSVAIDFHKTGFCPYMSTLLLVKNRADLVAITRPKSDMPYLYQTGHYHPGQWTLETSRAGTGPLAALANLLLFGKDGFRALLGHLVEMAEVLREELESHRFTTVLNGDNVGTVTLFRAYPDDVDPWNVKTRERTDPTYADRLALHNRFNRRLFELLTEDALAGDGVFLSLTDCYRQSDFGAPINALKSYILSPFDDESHVRHLVTKVLENRARAQAEFRPELAALTK